MSRALREFETALMAERVMMKFAKADLSPLELATMHCLTMYKSSARAKELEYYTGGEYTPTDPTMKGLIDKGYVKIQGKNIKPDAKKIDAELKQHKAPKLPGKPGLENTVLTFKRSDEPD